MIYFFYRALMKSEFKLAFEPPMANNFNCSIGNTILNNIFKFVQSGIEKRRGDCFGAFVAGLFFIIFAKRSDDPFVFYYLGTPLVLVGLLLSIYTLISKKKAM